MRAVTGQGTLQYLNVSDGGVPKTPIQEARLGRDGLEGDRQRDLRHHGGPERAVCLFGAEVIERLRAQGHPISPGSTGENLTLAGLDWTQIVPGRRIRFADGVELQITSFAVPCGTIRASFSEGAIARISAERHPGESRAYARVLTPGLLRSGESCTLLPADAADPEGGTT
jgi:MOSC domain-containing protein YiiM